MQRLCDQRVDYYFAAIMQYTVKMTQVMQECYAHSHNAQFNVRPARDFSFIISPTDACSDLIALHSDSTTGQARCTP